VAGALLVNAPFQCASDPDPNKAREESPGEALYGLSLQFEKQGNAQGREDTLRYLVARYPKSRFAGMAREDLEAMGKKP
jgi:hypothetical protein